VRHDLRSSAAQRRMAAQQPEDLLADQIAQPATFKQSGQLCVNCRSLIGVKQGRQFQAQLLSEIVYGRLVHHDLLS
jgi:hypothetical protein